MVIFFESHLVSYKTSSIGSKEGAAGKPKRFPVVLKNWELVLGIIGKTKNLCYSKSNRDGYNHFKFFESMYWQDIIWQLCTFKLVNLKKSQFSKFKKELETSLLIHKTK